MTGPPGHPAIAIVVAVACAGAAAALLVPVPARARLRAPAPNPTGAGRRSRWPWAALAGVGAAGFVGGPLAPVAGLAAAVVTWVVLARSEDPRDRRAREAAERDLPHVVGLLASALRAGAPPGAALAAVCQALPGAAADRLTGVRRLLDLGSDAERAWGELAADQVLAPLGRALARAASSGIPVAVTLERLADELADGARAATEDRARGVGVRAAVPLGLCLLPSFLLLGVVPVVAALLSGLVTD